MPKRKSTNKISDKMIGIMIGVALTFSAIGVINAVSVSFAHENPRNSMMSNGMMSGDMSMMHSMMMGGDGGMMSGNGDTSMMTQCMELMNQAASDGKITQEEMERMMQQMDKDGDGLCDYCGMSIEMCRKMMG